MRSRAVIFAWITPWLIVLPAVGLAQDDKKQEQAVKADMPGQIHQRLGELAGTWDVATRYVIGDKEHEGKATCEAKMILGGRFLQQDYSSIFQGHPFHVLQLWGYDNARKKSIEIMMDTMGTGVMHNEGTVSDDGKVITNSGESHDPTGKPYKLRTVTTIVDRDNFVIEWFGTEEGGKEAKTVTLTHKRKK
jgi:hypothetical protein